MASTAGGPRASVREPKPLTGREHEMLRAVGRGLSDAGIAAMPAIPETVVAHRLGSGYGTGRRCLPAESVIGSD